MPTIIGNDTYSGSGTWSRFFSPSQSELILLDGTGTVVNAGTPDTAYVYLVDADFDLRIVCYDTSTISNPVLVAYSDVILRENITYPGWNSAPLTVTGAISGGGTYLLGIHLQEEADPTWDGLVLDHNGVAGGSFRVWDAIPFPAAPTSPLGAEDASSPIAGAASIYLALDASAATLSSPTSASVTQTGATIGATTDDATGTLYGVVTTSATAPSATQIKAGQDHTGSAAAGSGSNASLSVGANTIAITGLTAATSYYYYLVQDNGADSNVVNGTFTTAVAAPTLTSPTAVSIGTTTVTPRVTTDTGNGTCYYVITPQAEGEPSNTQVEAGTNAADGAPVASGSQVVSSAGVITFSEVTGLTAGTAYRISYAHSGTPS